MAALSPHSLSPSLSVLSTFYVSLSLVRPRPSEKPSRLSERYVAMQREGRRASSCSRVLRSLVSLGNEGGSERGYIAPYLSAYTPDRETTRRWAEEIHLAPTRNFGGRRQLSQVIKHSLGLVFVQGKVRWCVTARVSCRVLAIDRRFREPPPPPPVWAPTEARPRPELDGGRAGRSRRWCPCERRSANPTPKVAQAEINSIECMKIIHSFNIMATFPSATRSWHPPPAASCSNSTISFGAHFGRISVAGT